MRFLRTNPSVWEAAYNYQVTDFEVSVFRFQLLVLMLFFPDT
jgi:hypothetical protein